MKESWANERREGVEGRSIGYGRGKPAPTVDLHSENLVRVYGRYN